MLKLENICLSYNKGTVDEFLLFDNYNLHIKRGEFVSVIGSNGSGKTSVLNLVCGSLSPDSGKIIFDGSDITGKSEFRRAAKIGRVFQDPKAGTCSNLSILENMALADNKNKPFGLGLAVNKNRIDYFKTLVSQCEMGLENRMNTSVGSLSGGQRQALAMVIANMSDIDLLVLDEHTAALDPKSAEVIMELTQKMVSKKQITTLMVTHNLRFAVNYGNRLLMMHQGEAVMDLSGEDKKNADVDMILDKFSRISVELGN